MQFHQDGFRTGDPNLAPASRPERQPGAPLPAQTDVLIVGCGPAGLTLAAQLSAFPGISTTIAEQKPGPLELGQADGVACRTVEMFQAFGFAEQVLREAYWVNETAFWRPDPADPKRIHRGGRILDTEPGLSEFPHVILNQARVHEFYLQVMRNSPSRLTPDYSRKLVELTVGTGDHPVTARFERTDPGHEGQVETIRARYAVGCDGARSAVRHSLGLELHGDSANHAWGVMDILATTDFPDIRLKCIIHSAQGSSVIIPREGGHLVRLYIEMDKLEEGERAASRKMTAQDIIAAANRIFHPYSIDVKQVAWWSIYEIGQRLTDRFDDADPATGRLPHVFIAGDACHTHSPKAGQGMNVSMQDAFNLGWKLAAVLQGRSDPALLATYSTERQAIAAELIDFDRRLARMFSTHGQPQAADPVAFQAHFQQQGRYTAGTATRYAPSVLTGKPDWQTLATGFPIGMRFHSAPVFRLADAKPMQLGHTVQADGRWRLFAFAGTADPDLSALCYWWSSPASPRARHAPAVADADAVIDLRGIFRQPYREMDFSALPSALKPATGKLGLTDYEKAFCADPAANIFDLRGIDPAGCIVIVRPDQYVAQVLPLSSHDHVARFFAGILLPV